MYVYIYMHMYVCIHVYICVYIIYTHVMSTYTLTFPIVSNFMWEIPSISQENTYVSHEVPWLSWQNHLGFFVREATSSFSPRLARGRRSTASFKGDTKINRAQGWNVRDMLSSTISLPPQTLEVLKFRTKERLKHSHLETHGIPQHGVSIAFSWSSSRSKRCEGSKTSQKELVIVPVPVHPSWKS